MDFDYDGFFEVENIINAIFNGVPPLADKDGEVTNMSAPGYPAAPAVTLPTISPRPSVSSRPSLSSLPSAALLASATSTASSGKTAAGGSPSWSSAPGVRGVDGDAQMRPSGKLLPARPVEDLPPPNLSTDIGSRLLLAPGKLNPRYLDMVSAIALLPKPKHHFKRTHSSAFADEEEEAVISPKYMSVAEACQLPEKKLRDELVKLYFEHFHQFCPVVDEFDFMETYNDIKDDEEFPKRIDITLFQAMMNVAFSHLPSARLLSTPYKSIFEGQRDFFDRTTLLYRVRHTSDHLILTQVALLLTFWSPFDSEYQVNNYWVARAFFHARVTRLWDWKRESEATSSRRRITWWCCLVRDRLISIALRRPYRMQENKGTWPSVKKEDFGLEIIFPKFSTTTTKVTAIECFIWLCKLSNIMRDIAVFHEKRRFDREWADKLVEETDVVPELAQVSRFSNQLKNWKEEYLKVSGEYIKSIRPGTSKMPSYVLIVCNSTLASLYLPYIHCPPGSIELVQRFQRVALRGIKSASSAVALHVHKLNSVSAVQEEFIVGIIAWIALPMAVFKVLDETGNRVTSDQRNGCYKDFVPFLAALTTRFHAAKLLMDIMGEDNSQIVNRGKELGVVGHSFPSRLPQAQGSVADERAGMNPDERKRIQELEEAQMLSCITKMVDLRLSTDGST